MARVAVLLAAVLAAAVLAPAAAALECDNIPLADRLDAADQAFVGKVTRARPAPGNPALRLYRFTVEKPLKGTVGPVIDLRARPLVDAENEPILKHRGESIGVLVTLDGATPTTTSCQLSSPGALIATFDEPRGNAIRVVVGVVILLLVLAYAMVRLRRKQRRQETPTA